MFLVVSVRLFVGMCLSVQKTENYRSEIDVTR